MNFIYLKYFKNNFAKQNFVAFIFDILKFLLKFSKNVLKECLIYHNENYYYWKIALQVELHWKNFPIQKNDSHH
jgi:hypothetical protein